MGLKRRVLTSLPVIAALVVVGIAALVVAWQRTLFEPPEGARPAIVIRGGTLFDGTGTATRANQGLVLQDGRIGCIGEDCAVPAGALEIDASGLAILPGFVDLHGHFYGRRDRAGILETIWDAARMRPELRRALLEAGITSYRSLGDPRDAVLETKRLLERRELAGPRLFVAGPIFTAPGGHPAYGGRDPNVAGVGGPMTFQSNDPDAIRREIALLAEQGVHGIKAVLHGAVSDDGYELPTLSTESFEALVDAARAHDLWVAVHAGPAHQTGQAARLGVTTIEHGVRQGNFIRAETLRALVDNGVIYVPTLGREPKGHVNIPPLVDAGVPLGVGTDVEDYHEELARLADAGVPAAEVLLAATRNGGRGLERGDVLGTLEPGRLADVVLVAGEPWKDVRDARSVVTVIQDGYVVVDRR